MTNTVHDFPIEQASAPPVLAETRPLYWTVRRELWENRWIYLAPLTVAIVVLFGFIFSTITLSKRMETWAAYDAAKQRELVTQPYSAVAGMLIFAALILGFFYCLDALYGERRDRAILFWKSLPVSDRTTVLAKACIPMIVLPLLVFTIAVTTQIVMLMMNTAVLLGEPKSLAMLWSHLEFVQMTLAFLYGLIAMALWHAPIYAWLLLLSAWAKRAVFLWAVLPLLAVFALEAMAMRTSHIASWVGHRLTGWFTRGFVFPPKGSKAVWDPFEHLTPGKLLSTPGFWIGLIFAAAFLTAAARMRRHREPI